MHWIQFRGSHFVLGKERICEEYGYINDKEVYLDQQYKLLF